MPYHINEHHADCAGYAVVKDDDGHVMGCHDTRDEANKQMSALYASESRSDVWAGPDMFMRAYPLEDIRILSRAQGSEYADGRTVEAYVAVFDRDAEIQDNEGHYLEVIDRAAFNKAIADSRPQGGRKSWNTSVFYNHGMTLYGTPAERFAQTLGRPVDIRAEERGLLTVTRYNENPLADEILESIRNGDITGHSFSGRKMRSDPARPPSRTGYRRSTAGNLSTVRRLELGLREYGPTPFPAYVDTAVVGVRSMIAALGGLNMSTTQSEPVDIDTTSDEVAVTDEPHPEGMHSGRDQEEAARSQLLQRIAVARRARPGLARKDNDD